jgi:apolipoprotein N-acyltransferase
MFTYKSAILSICLSLFIYLEYFLNIQANQYDIIIRLFNTTFVLFGYYLLFKLSKKELFLSGFFIGILWFWWIGYSFIYYELSYLIPIIIIGIGFVYAVLFYIIGISNNIYFKISYIFILSYIEPFGFNWFKIELPLINSFLGSSKLEFLLLLIVTAVLVTFIHKYIKQTILFYISAIICLIYFNTTTQHHTEKPNIKIYQYQTNIAQDKKWKKAYKVNIIENNLKHIDLAIKNNYDLIILPETAFPLVLNHQYNLQNTLMKKSQKISILTGSLYEKDKLFYNSTYLYQNGIEKVAHKVVLVPFGEAVPLPQKIRDWINNTFYNGAKDYKTADTPTTFTIKGVKFRSAICYEATTDKIYENLDTNYAIAISNNAWFTPSHQPTLQKLLLKYFENKYNITILSVTNQG